MTLLRGGYGWLVLLITGPKWVVAGSNGARVAPAVVAALKVDVGILHVGGIAHIGAIAEWAKRQFGYHIGLAEGIPARSEPLPSKARDWRKVGR